MTRPIHSQSERESQRLWAETTAAIKKGDHRVATDEKSKIEDRQRVEATNRGEAEWKPQLFKKVIGSGGGPGNESGEESLDWVIAAEL